MVVFSGSNMLYSLSRLRATYLRAPALSTDSSYSVPFSWVGFLTV